MISLIEVGNKIKNKRLSLNMRMDDVARQADISRSTLWSIENGQGNYSFSLLIKILGILGMSIHVDSNESNKNHRDRATRVNTLNDKKINRFVIFTIEQYAKSVNKNSGDVYKELNKNEIINELVSDYEDLHGMSTMYLNDYINALIKGAGR